MLCNLSQLMQLINGVVLSEADRLALSSAGVAVREARESGGRQGVAHRVQVGGQNVLHPARHLSNQRQRSQGVFMFLVEASSCSRSLRV